MTRFLASRRASRPAPRRFTQSGLVTAAAIAAAALTAVAGCSSSKSKSTPTTGSSGTASVAGAKIQFASWGSQEAATKADFQGFVNSFNSSTQAQVSSVGWPYDSAQQQMVTKIKAGQAPDVGQVDINWITSFAAQGALVDLNQVYGKDKLAAEYPPNALKLGQRNGMQVALPWTLSSIALVANKQILQKAGISVLPKTTAEFTADLAKIKRTQPGVIPYGLDTKTPALVTPFVQPWLWTFGGTVIKDGKVAVNSAGTVNALNYLSGLVKQNLVQKDFDIFSARTLFAQGKVAFYDDAIIARGLVSTNKALAANVVPVPRPVANAGDAPQSIQWGHALVMFKKKNRSAAQNAAAASFLSSLETPAVTSNYFKSQGLIPASNAGLQSAASSSDAYQKGWAAITSTSRLDETAPYVNGAQISEIVGRHAQAAYLGIESPDKAAKSMSDELGQLNLK